MRLFTLGKFMSSTSDVSHRFPLRSQSDDSWNSGRSGGGDRRHVGPRTSNRCLFPLMVVGRHSIPNYSTPTKVRVSDCRHR